MLTRNSFIWKSIQVISWIIFIGLCIQTGALVFNYIFSFFKPMAAQNLYMGLDLSGAYNQSKMVYTYLFSFIVVLSALKAYVFYIVVKIFTKLNLIKPFSQEISMLVTKISHYAFSIAIISYIAQGYTKRLVHKGYGIGAIENYWDDSGAFLFMAAIVFVIALVFKKGAELQNENDLTI